MRDLQEGVKEEDVRREGEQYEKRRREIEKLIIR